MTITAETVSEDLRLCQALRERGKLDRAGFDRAWRWHQETGQPIDKIVTSLGLVPERGMAEILADHLSAPLLSENDYPTDAAIENSMSLAFLKEAGVLPIADTADGLVVAMVNPRDEFARRAIEIKFQKNVIVRVAVPSELEAAIDRLYGEGKSSLSEIVENIGAAEGELDGDAERLKNLASEAPVVRLVNLIISSSVETRASDVHIEPFEDRLRVRYRIDGILREVESPPSRLRFAIISRIKIMARLDIAERRLPQDGRINLIVRGKEIDLRVSTVPTMHGESVVLRILDKSGGVASFEQLGFAGSGIDNLMTMLQRPNGIVLVTGPTGSGKTTTLYSALSMLNTVEKKVVTVEDPIEYQLYGVNQIQAKPQIGLDFANILRSVLRQDPDIIMIGEIRDLETAQIAVQASLTGHLVLSTLHTNSAAATISRLIDMGVDDYLLASTLSGIVAQRLVRTLCPTCKEPYSPLPEIVDELHLGRLTDNAEITLYRTQGCEQCAGSGYFGRICIGEVMVMDDAINSLLMKRADTRQIHDAATGSGMRTMFEDGLCKALEGTTSIEEIIRVTRES